MATILYLRLDSSYDPVFDPNVALQDATAVQQAIQTRLLLFQSEWWENSNEGTPLFQSILGLRKRQSNQDVASTAISARIAATPFVSAVTNVLATVDVNRKLTFSGTVTTIFSAVPLKFTVSPLLPGSLGS